MVYYINAPAKQYQTSDYVPGVSTFAGAYAVADFMIKRTCQQCGEQFETYNCWIKKGGGCFCSRRCAGIKKSLTLKGNKYACTGGGIKNKCEICGKEFYVSPGHIKKGWGRYCSKKCMAVWQSKNLTGNKSSQWNGGLVHSICKTCGKEFKRSAASIKQGGGKYCGRYCYSKSVSNRQKGENNPYWKGGISPENVKIRNSPMYNIWRKKVFVRDVYCCVNCGAKGIEFNAHHILLFSKFPQFRFDIWNGETLCENCHKIEHKGEL